MARTAALVLLLTFAPSLTGAAVGPRHPADFQPNLGQLDERVGWWARQPQVELFVTREGELVHRLAGEAGSWVVVERFADALPMTASVATPAAVRVTWIDGSGTHSAQAAQRLDLGEPWAGIRADLQAAGDGFEKRFHLAPGASVDRIRVAVDGIEGMRLTPDGRLLMQTGLGIVELSAPVAWQDIGAQRLPVQVAYVLPSDTHYGFALGTHDPQHALTIDPVIRSTFVGGSGEDDVQHLAVADDSVYVTGYTLSANFPGTAGGFQPAISRTGPGGGNIYLARYSLDLRTLLQATYFGSHGPIGGGVNVAPTSRWLAVSGDSVYITGRTAGNAGLVPGTEGGAQPQPGGGSDDAFVARFSRDLTELLQATYLGGSSAELAWPIAVSADGVYVAGQSASTDLPGLSSGAVSAPPVPTGSGAAFVTRLALDLRSVLASSFVSSGGWDMEPRAIALADDGSVYVAGDGSNTLFNTGGAFQASRQSTGFTRDGFLVRLSADLGTLHRSTYLGGSGNERIDDIEWNGLALYVGGSTGSLNFPVSPGAAQTTHAPGAAFVAALSGDLSSRVAATFFGNAVSVGGIALRDGELFLGGTTTSTTLPGTTAGAEPVNPGGTVGYAARLSETLDQIRMASYVATGVGTVQVFGLGLGSDTLYLAGRTQANTLPGSQDGAQPDRSGSWDAFILASTLDLAGPLPEADLAVEKTGSTRRLANRWLRYRVRFSNLGPDTAVDARLQDELPPELGATNWVCSASGGAACPAPAGSGSLDAMAALPAQAELVFEFCGLVSGGTDLVINTAMASVSPSNLDPVSGNNAASWVVEDPSLFYDGFEALQVPVYCPEE